MRCQVKQPEIHKNCLLEAAVCCFKSEVEAPLEAAIADNADVQTLLMAYANYKP